MTISNDILLRRGNIKQRLSKNLVCQGDSLDAATNAGGAKYERTPATQHHSAFVKTQQTNFNLLGKSNLDIDIEQMASATSS
jgi:hypothetical protein